MDAAGSRREVPAAAEQALAAVLDESSRGLRLVFARADGQPISREHVSKRFREPLGPLNRIVVL